MDHVDTLFSASGKTALVTGGAAGIGRMIAEALVRAGARVLLASRKADSADQAAAELNALGGSGFAEGLIGNVATEAGVLALVEETRRRTDRLSILVNNAGKAWGAPLDAFPYKAWESVIAVNVTGLFHLTQQLLPLLEAAGTTEDPARVINLGSVSGILTAGEDAYSYAASKAAVHHLTRILARELAVRRITVNALAPGIFPSPMTAFGTGEAWQREKLSARIPLARLGVPSDIAAAVLFLCGQGGAYTTGALLPLDGGLSVSAGLEMWEETRA